MNVLAADIHSISVMKAENDSVLIIHSDAPVTSQVILELFQLVPRTLQIIKTDSSIENIQFANHDLPNSPVDLSRGFRISAVIDVLGRLIRKGLNH